MDYKKFREIFRGLDRAYGVYYKGETKFAPIHCSDLTDTIQHVISNNIYSKIIECVGPEIITFKEIIKKLLNLIELGAS